MRNPFVNVQPDPRDIVHVKNVVKENAKFGLAGATRLDENDFRTLDRYIEFLEEQLASVIPEFQGIPTEYFNMVKREKMEWRPLGPTPLYLY